jgi:probable selenium-dependent hydroxylase accessory protein YqeC
MWYFQRIDPLRLFSGHKYISVVGAGGKTTFIEYLARRQAEAGRTAAVTTTTKIYAKEPFALFPDMGRTPKERIMRVGKTLEGEKLTALTFDEVKALGGMADMVLIEADGAKHCPLKYPSHHEPVIPPFSDCVCVVAGLDGLYGKVKEQVFRWERFHAATGTEGEATVSPEVFLSLFSEHAMLKGVERGKCAVVLNKYDALADKGMALRLAKGIIEDKGLGEVILSSAAMGFFYRIRRV